MGCALSHIWDMHVRVMRYGTLWGLGFWLSSAIRHTRNILRTIQYDRKLGPLTRICIRNGGLGVADGALAIERLCLRLRLLARCGRVRPSDIRFEEVAAAADDDRRLNIGGGGGGDGLARTDGVRRYTCGRG